MTEWKARRFWKAATIQPVDGGWQIALDDRPVRTPGKLPLVLPTMALAQAIAAEWDAQDGTISPNTMPLTRAANTAIERVPKQFDGIVDALIGYGGTDLLCYRADQPEALVQMQSTAWDPLIGWAATELQAPLLITHGVVPVDQPAESLQQLRACVGATDEFGLTALHDLVTLSGSLILGLAVTHGRMTAQEAYRLSRIDETYQSSQWGKDDEAEAAATNKESAILSAAKLWSLSRLCQ